MLLLAFTNADIQFDGWSLTSRSYTLAEPLPRTRRVELIDQEQFAKVTLAENFETYVIYVAALKPLKPAMAIDLI